jgi:hypothetical protein
MVSFFFGKYCPYTYLLYCQHVQLLVTFYLDMLEYVWHIKVAADCPVRPLLPDRK